MIVAIDDRFARAMNLPPAPHKWPRQLHSQLIKKLSERQPSVIVFDLIFFDPQDDFNDQAFATAIRDAGNVVLTQSIDRQTMPVVGRSSDITLQLNIERLMQKRKP